METIMETTMNYVTPHYVINGKVALEPFQEMEVQKEQRGGMVVPKQNNSLTKLKVLIDSGKQLDSTYFPAGCTVWVRADTFRAPWAKEVYELEGQKFILAPIDQVLLVQY